MEPSRFIPGERAAFAGLTERLVRVRVRVRVRGKVGARGKGSGVRGQGSGVRGQGSGATG